MIGGGIVKPQSPVTMSDMTSRQKVEFLLHQIAALPEEPQAELVQALVEMQAERSGIYYREDDEHEALASYTPRP
jgi:hypothetical protein